MDLDKSYFTEEGTQLETYINKEKRVSKQLASDVIIAQVGYGR